MYEKLSIDELQTSRAWVHAALDALLRRPRTRDVAWVESRARAYERLDGIIGNRWMKNSARRA